jgi:type IV pilus assembly protein PilA
MMPKAREDGFTLIELMLVIAIVALVAAIAIPLLQSYRARAYKAACIADGQSAYRAAIQYFLDHPCAS